MKSSHKGDEGEESSVPISDGTEYIDVEGEDENDGATTEAPSEMIEKHAVAAHHFTSSEHHSASENEEDDALLLLLRSLRLESYHSRFVQEEVLGSDCPPCLAN